MKAKSLDSFHTTYLSTSAEFWFCIVIRIWGSISAHGSSFYLACQETKLCAFPKRNLSLRHLPSKHEGTWTWTWTWNEWEGQVYQHRWGFESFQKCFRYNLYICRTRHSIMWKYHVMESLTLLFWDYLRLFVCFKEGVHSLP